MRRRIYLSPPWTGAPERAAVERAFDSGYVAPCGPCVDEFDRRLGALSGMRAAAVASGTAAIDLLMDEFGVGRGTVVVASSLTFVATVGPAFRRGAAPVFVDSDPATGTMSVPLLERALSDVSAGRRRIVVIPADIYGQCCDYDAIEALCAECGATMVADAAESLGASYKGRPAGSAGAAAVYSFNGNKIVTTSGGGAVLSRDPEIVARARWRAQQSRENTVWYEHREVGCNYRMSNILAAMGCAQLDRLPKILERKKRNFDFYSSLFAGTGVKPFPCADCTAPSRWLSVFLFPASAARDAAAARLAADGIESRPVWKPMHLQPVFAKCAAYGGEVSADLFARGLCLPSGAGLSAADLSRIARALAPE